MRETLAGVDPRVLESVRGAMAGVDPRALEAAMAGVDMRAVTESVAFARKVMAQSGDGPVCSLCGHMTIRNGSCFICLTCGETTGCS